MLAMYVKKKKIIIIIIIIKNKKIKKTETNCCLAWRPVWPYRDDAFGLQLQQDRGEESPRPFQFVGAHKEGPIATDGVQNQTLVGCLRNNRTDGIMLRGQVIK